MKYYQIKNSIDLDIVGTIPQINQISGAKQKDVELYDNLLYLDSFPQDIPKLDSLILNSGAILTDYINITFFSPNYSILVSDEFRNIIEKSILSNANFYNASVINNNQKHNYYLLYFLKAYPLIDYNSSKFILSGFEGSVLKELIFKSKDEYDKYDNFEIGEFLQAKSIRLKETVDLFNLSHNGIFFSEKLKNDIENKKLTGFIFEESTIEFTL